MLGKHKNNIALFTIAVGKDPVYFQSVRRYLPYKGKFRTRRSNKIYLQFFLFCILAGIIVACNKNSNRVTINPENRQLIVPVQLNDSVTSNMVFDTGYGVFTLDSSFCVSHNIDLDNPDAKTLTGSAWTDKSSPGFVYHKHQDIKIGNVELTYPELRVYSWNKYINSNDSDGILGVPPQDTTHVWELNFEHNYLEIHKASSFRMPKTSFVLPIELEEGYQGYSFYVKLPMFIKCANGDTLAMNHTYYIDTGMFNGVAVIFPSNEWEFFNKKEDAVWTQDSGRSRYSRHYTVSATLFDSLVLDSLRIYTVDDSQIKFCKYLLGLNFLKRFNVFFDLKNRRIGLQPINNFQRIVNPLCRRFHYSTIKTQDGKTIVSKVADYTSNYFRTAGLKEGDEIIAINGISYSNYSYDFLNHNSNSFINALRNKNTIYEDGHFFFKIPILLLNA
jgi:hypothetical protein